MMFNDILYLVEEGKKIVDEYGDEIKEECYRKIYCEVKSIGVSEFYQAMTSNRKPEIKVVISDYLDYRGEQEVILKDFRYKVLRTYKTSTNQLEITLYGGVRWQFQKV